MIKDLSKSNSILNQYVAELRDVKIQQDSMRFRRNMERIGEIFAYEVSKHVQYQTEEVTTPLGISEVPLLKEEIVCGTILRAGLPLHQGLLNIFDKAENAFITAYRKHHKDGNFEIEVEYVSSPELDDKVVLLSDPMLATGSSMHLAYKALMEKGNPKHTHIISILSSLQGINYMKQKLSSHNVTIWTAAIDDELTAKAYIVPGLGDAGDLAFGSKSDKE